MHILLIFKLGKLMHIASVLIVLADIPYPLIQHVKHNKVLLRDMLELSHASTATAGHVYYAASYLLYWYILIIIIVVVARVHYGARDYS